MTAGEASGPDARPADRDILLQLERILASTEFARAGRMSRFLRFIVEQTLEGQADRLKEYTIALAVFGRDKSFDPQTSPIEEFWNLCVRNSNPKYTASVTNGFMNGTFATTTGGFNGFT